MNSVLRLTLRINSSSIKEAYVAEKNGELWLCNCHIKRYQSSSDKVNDPIRQRKLLISKKELNNTINIKVRSTGRMLKAKVKVLETSANIEILDKEAGISPGQACVFYDRKKKMIGGGWMSASEKQNN